MPLSRRRLAESIDQYMLEHEGRTIMYLIGTFGLEGGSLADIDARMIRVYDRPVDRRILRNLLYWEAVKVLLNGNLYTASEDYRRYSLEYLEMSDPSM